MRRPRPTLVPFLLGALAGAVTSLAAVRLKGGGPPPLARVDTPLDRVNDGFHAFYDDAREQAELDAPVFIILADTLVLFRGQERQAFSFTPRLFHVIKSAAHGPVALYAALHRLGDAPIDPETGARLAAARRDLDGALASFDREVEEPEAIDNLRGVVRACLAFVDRTVARGRIDAADLEAFARGIGPALLRSTDDATRIQLSALDAHVRRALARMDAGERRAFHVVITGDHQARVRSLGMQYFQKLLGEAPGEEHRVAYAEGVTDEAEAIALVGTQRLDRAIASAFFGDAKRLQQDVLGNAVKARLAAVDLPKIA